MFNNVYYFDEARSILWILPAKNASTSIKAAVGLNQWISREAALGLNQYFTVGVIRHPFERLVSALYTVHMGMEPFAERLHRARHDSHVRPQAPAFEELRVDFWLRVERLAEDWKHLQSLKDLPELTHVNTGSRANGRPADWRDACNWTEFMPIYEKDFELCSRASPQR